MNEARRDFRLKNPLGDLRQGPPSESASAVNEEILQAIKHSDSLSQQDLEKLIPVDADELAGRLTAMVNLRLLDIHSETAGIRRYRLSTTGEQALAQHRLSVAQ